MKKKYYLSDPAGKIKIFSSFNSLLRYLKLSEEEELKIADSIGKTAFTGEEAKSYRDEQLGITIEYR